MRRLVSILLVAVVGVGALALTGAKGDEGALKSYDMVFDNGFGLVEGGDLKIGGVKAGRTTGFRLTEREPYKVIASAEVTEPGFEALRRDARCDVRQQSLIGEYFIDCDLGSKDAPELPDRGRIPASQTSSTIPPDLINTIMRRPYRERFRLIISELGAGLAGRPRELNEVIRRAHPALRETSQTINILRRQNKTIRDFFKDADEVSLNVEKVKDQVARWAEESADTAGIQASRAEHVGQYWNRLPTFLRELEPTMRELGRTADRQIPTLRKLEGAAPELEAFLRQAAPFARASRGSIDDLGSASEAGLSAVRESRQEIRELRRLSVNAPKLGKPLRQLLQALDDRRRSIEEDPQAATTSPPAPDKTAYRKGQGFTGMENLWNYFLWQTLAINGFDQAGHVLRLIAFTGGPCSPYNPDPSQATFDECAVDLGPSHPGVLGEPDPTDDGTIQKEAAERRRSTRAQRERHRGAGEPEAPPTPGKPDPSKPQIVIPEDVRELLERLGRPKLPSVPQDGTRTPDHLLDYLLG
jgi:ABC-type transporter Mla subunit MlaD